MKTISENINVRAIKDGDWYWVSKRVIQEYGARVGFLPLGVYHFLACMADENQSCYPSQKYIAERLGCSRSSISRAVKLLEKHGLVKVTKGARYHSVYQLLHIKSCSGEIEMSQGRNRSVPPVDINNTTLTRINNDNVTEVKKPVNHDFRKNFKPKTREELLAFDLMNSLDDYQSFPLYLSYARKYPESFLREMLSKVNQTPTQRIKKSRGALFNFLVRHHAERNS